MRKQEVNMTHEDIQRAIRRFLAKGGLIRKLPPAATPRTWGIVARKPNRAPEAVSRMTFGPGENSPAKTKG